MIFYTNSSLETSDGALSSGEGKRNRKTQALSALLSATALGVFLEGCGGAPSDAAPPPPPAALSVDVSGTALAAAGAEAFVGDDAENTISYAGAGAGVTVDLQTPANNRGRFAAGDTYENIENIQGSSHADTLIGDSQDNTLDGGEGEDTLDGGAGDDKALYGDSGVGVRVDLSQAGAQADFDTNTDGFTASEGGDAVGDTLVNIENVEGSSHNDWLTGDGNANTLVGGGGNDRLEGGGGEDTLQGGTGDDTLHGGVGADTLDGGAGDDEALYGDSGVGVRVDLSLTTQVDFADEHGFTPNDNEAEGDTLTEIENVEGSAHNDWLTGNDENNDLRGGGGNDRLEGGAGEDTYLFNAGDGTDTITDYGGNIVFEQGTNNDYAGATYAFSNVGGNVRLSVTKGGETLNTIDFTSHPSGYTFSTRSDGTDRKIPDTSLVLPIPGSAASPFKATEGANTFRGYGDNDWVSYASSNEAVTIQLRGSYLATVSGGWAAGDRLYNIDNLIGSDHADTLSGDYNVANSLEGGRGDDVLAGGSGRYSADTYVFNAGDGTDTINDDGGKIVFKQGTDNDYAGATYAFTYVGNNVRLTVTKDSDTLNVIDFVEYPSSYSFTTRATDGSDTAIPTTSLVFPERRGDEDNPFLATAVADILIGDGIYDWVSYAGSNEGVTIDLRYNPATVSGGWAAGDRLTDIYNLIGSDHADTLTGDYNVANSFEGGRGDDVLAGGWGADTYVFNAGDGTDTITDDRGNKIVFKQGTDNDYAGATYAFTYVGGKVRLIVEKDGSTLNTIDFSTHPSSYTFTTRGIDGSDTVIPASLLVLPGSAGNPFLATADADSFRGTGNYDWVSYADSNEGVTIDLDGYYPATVSGGWAAGDTLIGIRNLIGSRYADTLTGDSDANSFEGGRGNDVLVGVYGIDTYVFNAFDGTDTITDDGGKIVFKQGTHNDYAGATYAFAYIEGSSGVRLTVEKDGNTLNTIDFSHHPSDYTFTTRATDGSDTAIPTTSLVLPPRRGAEDNPFLATASADTFIARGEYDWVSYAGSNEGVTIDLDVSYPATVSGGWAAGDYLRYIDNLIGSDHADTLTGTRSIFDRYANTFEGGRGDDVLAGRLGTDTYVFNAGDGTDTITDAGGKIVFKQGLSNDYTGATYAFDYVGNTARLTVTKGSDTLNTIDFSTHPSSYTFTTRGIDGSDTAIPTTSLVLLATSSADSFRGSATLDWVSYAGSNEGVTIDLRYNTARVSGGWAAGDRLTDIDNLIGSDHADTLTGNRGPNSFEGGRGNDELVGGEGEDTLEGGRGNDELVGGEGADTYVFNAGDGTDTVTDDGGKIVFKQGTDNDYAGATYAFAYIEGSGRVRLMVEKDGNTLNVIDFVGYPSSYYSFITRATDGSDTAIPDSSLSRFGDENNPFLATDSADTFIAIGSFDWVSYAGSNEAVTIQLRGSYPATVSGGWAAGDTLIGIRNLIGSDHADTLTGSGSANSLEGGRGDDVLAGGSGADTYVFNAGDGTDTINDDGGKIVFKQGTDNDYAGATYTFAYAGGNVRLTVEKDGNTLNVIEFTRYPSSYYSFITRATDGSDTAIPTTSLVLPPRRGAEDNPFLATASADTFRARGEYDWVSYAGSNEGVTIDLSDDPATVSGGWAAGDTLRYIENLIGSDHADTLTGDDDRNTFEGGRGDDVLAGGRSRYSARYSADTYVFNAGDGTDTITDDGGKIVFKQGTDNDYAGATYAFTYVGGNVRLTVEKDGNTLNVIEFTFIYPSYRFITRATDGSDTAIPDSSLSRFGDENNPFLATDSADTFIAIGSFDWATYAGSNEGVTIDLSYLATVSGGWAAGDTLIGIRNLIGSRYGDTLRGDNDANTLRGEDGNDRLYGNGGNDIFEGGRGDDVLAGGGYTDTYVFNAGDGTDTITDYYGDNIVFKQGTDNDYAGATYAFAYIEGSNGVRLMVEKDGNTLNVIEFTYHPSSYSFTTRATDGSDTAIPTTSLVLPPRRGAEDNPFLATASADTFRARGEYDWVSYAGSNEGVTIDLSDDPATVSGGWAAGDTLRYIENLIGSDHADTLTGHGYANIFEGGRGDDVLAGGYGTDTYVFNAGDGTDTIKDTSGTMTLRFGSGYTAADFLEASNNFRKVGDHLEITIDKIPTDGIDDKITIENAYNHPSEYTDTRTGNAAFTINIEYGSEGSDTFTEVTNTFWHTLT